MRTATAYELATLAGTHAPDTLDSVGAQFLTGIRDAFYDMWDGGQFDDFDDCDVITELSDSTVPVATSTQWGVFVDLALYFHDEFGAEAERTHVGAAANVLGHVALQLVTALTEFERD